ncbi:hypothetical protein Tco_0839713 [Tanacetum coccineum]|uniref:Reverse transcriptase Ty1/copia-type domain-containing protein n=1 Tax=Tanacetum coccineum TaxID=301880 RepID=A0ABQ5AVZ9_9ASTR
MGIETHHGEEEKKDAEDPGNEGGNLSEEGERINQEKDTSVNSTNNINTVSPTINTTSIEHNVIDENTVYGCVDDPNIPDLEEISIFSDAENDNSRADINNLDTYFHLMDVWVLFFMKRLKRKSMFVNHQDLKKDRQNFIYQEGPSSMGELTIFLGLEVKQKEDRIFISQDKYVTEILKKLALVMSKQQAHPWKPISLCSKISTVMCLYSNEKKLIQMIKIYTDQNVADLLTKAFDVSRFQYLIASIGMLNL